MRTILHPLHLPPSSWRIFWGRREGIIFSTDRSSQLPPACNSSMPHAHDSIRERENFPHPHP